MTLTHERLPAGQVPNHLTGWTAIAGQLDAVLTAHRAGVIRPAEG